jgi:hypothetical protein
VTKALFDAPLSARAKLALSLDYLASDGKIQLVGGGKICAHQIYIIQLSVSILLLSIEKIE